MFNRWQIQRLKYEYSKVDRVSTVGYEKLSNMLEKLDLETLRQLAEANIKFVSRLAKNRI